MEEKLNDNLIIASGQNVSVQTVWDNALRQISLSQNISAVVYDVWIATLEPVEIKGNAFVLATPSISSKKRLMSADIKKTITAALNSVQNSITSVEFIVGSAKEELKEEEEKEPELAEEEGITSSFNPKYTFDTFVIGSSNQFVAAAAKAVADNPAGKHNPLFIYGGVGLGKTHLLHAIGNHINETKPNLNVVYVTCDKFVNDLIQSIYDSKKSANATITAAFRSKYRKADVLIVDDIQFITNKNAVQTEFFHTFNELYESGKQIIISSDQPPKELNPLEERLRSRFEWGIIADIGIPDIETKIAILSKKAQLEHYNVSRDVIEYIAGVSSTNIRELEGMLARAVFYSGLLGEGTVTLENAREALKNIVVEGDSELDAGKIIDAVCKFYNIKKDELLARKRTKEIAQARQVAMYLIFDMLDMPLVAIGNIFGKDHATVIYAKTKVTEDMAKDKKFATEVSDIRQMVKGK